MQPAALREAGPAAAARPRISRGGKVAQLGRQAGNYTLLLGRGLDGLAALGGERRRRVRAWSLAGNDYVRRGVHGVSFKSLASGLFESILAKPFDSATLEGRIRKVLEQLSSSAKQDQAWRGSGVGGRVRKLDRIVISGLLVTKLVESERLGNGLQADCYISSSHVSPSASQLDYGNRPPIVARDPNPTASSARAPEATHDFICRPADPSGSPEPTQTNPRRENPIQPRRPKEDGSNQPQSRASVQGHRERASSQRRTSTHPRPTILTRRPRRSGERRSRRTSAGSRRTGVTGRGKRRKTRSARSVRLRASSTTTTTTMAAGNRPRARHGLAGSVPSTGQRPVPSSQSRRRSGTLQQVRYHRMPRHHHQLLRDRVTDPADSSAVLPSDE